MQLLPLTVACPRCGSGNVVYSCEPKCCFNHVCSDCYADFELSTRDRGEKRMVAITVEPGERDTTAPTAACARCDSLDLYRIVDGEISSTRLICASCHTLLDLIIADVPH